MSGAGRGPGHDSRGRAGSFGRFVRARRRIHADALQEEFAVREEKLAIIRDQLAHELKAAANEKDQWSARRQQLEIDHESVANLRELDN